MNIGEARTESLNHAWEAGRWAAEAGRGIETCPLFSMGELGKAWRDAWRTGWRSVRG